MKLVPQSPKIALKAFIKQKPLRSEIDVFKANLITLLDKISVIERRPKDETEEHLKNDLRDFLRDTYYRDKNAINTKDKKDLVVHCTEKTTSDVAVIIEAKRPTNIGEMITAGNPNKKALHELILYYLDERHAHKNNQLKHLVITNIHQWYIIDANYFDKHIERNSQIKKLYETKVNDKKDNPFFYEEIAKICDKIDLEIPCVYFDIRSYDTILRNSQKDDDRELTALYKILSPQHLLKIATPNDSNSLNEKFYKELLHIIGLEEAKESGKNIIRRKLDKRNHASLIEATIEAIHTEDVLHRIPDISIYGDSKDERIFAIALELTITWINRCLFLKLLEGQLVAYHKLSPHERERSVVEDFHFLNTSTIHDFDELFKLFHKVLAVHSSGRSAAITAKYSKIPYLNSSLFEISELEDHTVKINSLDNSGKLELMKGSILTSPAAKPLHLERAQNGESVMPPLQYLFEFLDSYDFASDGTDDIQDDNKTIINASVLGKVFEKINGYKDGSIFTPGFITMYMCRKAIRLAVVQKFKDAYGWNIDTFDDIKNYLVDRRSAKDILEFNAVINSLRLCDPAVGSGHYLVSALNEFIVIKYELGIFADENGNRIRDYSIEIVNDELLVTDFDGNIFEYKMRDGKPLNNKIQQLQKTLFHEKQTIIENCLFGVDINPNSVKICRLRLWIELLKSAYYDAPKNPPLPLPRGESELRGEYYELETLPNIDINIKCGNSLLSRFALDADLSKALKSIKYDIKAYRGFVDEYKNCKSREVKRSLQHILDSIKNDFRTEISKHDPKVLRYNKLSGELYTLLNQTRLIELTEKEKKAEKATQLKLEAEITKLTHEIDDIKSNAIYKNAFEWRFEFPEVLNNNGDFEGFDVVVGNPPYFSLSKIKEQGSYFEIAYETYSKSADIYCLFYEKGVSVLKAKGMLAFITSNSWMRTQYGKPLREFFVNKSNPQVLINIEDTQICNEATVESNILITQKSNWSHSLTAVSLVNDYSKEQILDDYIRSKSNIIKELNPDGWIIGNDAESVLKLKIENEAKILRDWDVTIYRGVTTGLNDAFVINEETKDTLLTNNPNSANIIKPVLRGRDLTKFSYSFQRLWIICTFQA
ncbi:MAG: class I SAM-dependent DNA methyltransferase [Ignavibacteria bacterium]|nr:class I SAM-dependent DNA methyltransferase [Ignavibacteria bacterium]